MINDIMKFYTTDFGTIQTYFSIIKVQTLELFIYFKHSSYCYLNYSCIIDGDELSEVKNGCCNASFIENVFTSNNFDVKSCN